MRLAVDEQAAHAANAFTAIVIEGDRVLALAHKVVVQHIEHLQKGHVGRHIVHRIGLDLTLFFRACLSPDLQRQFHC